MSHGTIYCMLAVTGVSANDDRPRGLSRHLRWKLKEQQARNSRKINYDFHLHTRRGRAAHLRFPDLLKAPRFPFPVGMDGPE